MRPSGRAVALFAAVSAFGITSAFFPVLSVVAWAAASLVLGLFAIDSLLSRSTTLVGEREVATSLSLQQWSDVTIRLSEASRGVTVEIFDHFPDEGEAEGLPRTMRLEPNQAGEMSYRFRPLRRGKLSFGRIELRLHSRLGWWRRRYWVGQPVEVRSYPDFSRVQRFAVLAVDDKLSALGVKRRRRRGEATELHQLREYRDGDSPRHIDWKATSRRRQLISREFEDERNQNLVFMLDCSRRMRAQDGDLSHFDHALNSMLLLSYVALRQGDAVGLMAVGSEERWLPPQRGGLAMKTVLNTVYDLETDLQAADYATAATHVMSRQRRRSLVVLISNLRDEDADEISAAVRLLRRRHLVMVASLREAVLDELLEKEFTRFREALRYGALHHYLEARRFGEQHARSVGAAAIDVTPSQLPMALVHQYLAIKRAGAL